MKIINLTIPILLARFIKSKPVLVTWHITNKCQSKCVYCDYWKSKKTNELPLQTIKSILDELEINGTKFIHFTGGEPLLRKDCVRIFKYAKNKNFYLSLNSNGILLPEKFNQIYKYIDFFKISLDGTSETHNKTRGINCYNNIITALTFIKKHNKKAIITCTISKLNASKKDINFLIDLAKKYQIIISFQLAYTKKLSSFSKNKYALTPKQYHCTLDYLIKQKKSKNGRYISNSMSVLKYLKNKYPVNCSMRKIAVKIDAQGNLSSCGVVPYKINPLNNCVKYGFAKAYKALIKNKTCNKCWCTMKIESNLILSFRLHIFFNYLRNKVLF